MHGLGRWQRAVICAATGVSSLAGGPAALAAQPPQPPAFRSGVELVAVDVNIVDRRGNPVPHLGPDQFEVTIDGETRRVVTAEFIEYTKEDAKGVVGTATASAARRFFTTNENSAQAVSPGRLVILAVDQGSFRAFGARAAMEAARRFIDRLQPADRIGLVAFPPPGPQVAPSRNHGAAREMALQMVGTATSFSGTASAVRVSLGEAIDIRTGDSMTLDRVMDRECPGASGSGLQYCRQMVTMEAASIGMGAEMQATRSLWGLEAVIKGLAAVRERKTLVLVSAGLPVSDRIGMDLQLTQRVAELGRLAAAANLNLYVLHVDTSFLDAFSASERTVSDTLWRDMGMMSAGLETIAGASGGSLARIVAGADAAFDCVLRETSAVYLLGVEPGETERDGRAHRIAVKVKLPGVEVRSRREVLLPKAAAPPASPEEALAEALQSPRVATDLPVRVSTLTMATEAGGALRVLITADIGSAQTSPVEMRVGFVVANAAGDVKASAGQKLSLTPRPTSGAGALWYLADVHLEPGVYTLRLAASDPAGKIGSVEHAFTVGLAEGTGVQIGALLLLDAERTRDETSAPVTDDELHGRSVDVYVEARPTSKELAVTGVTFGISDTPEGAPLVSLPVAVTRKDAGAPWAAAARLDLGPLPPGDYTAFASLTSGTQVVGRVTRPLRIGRPAPFPTGSANPAAFAPRVSFAAGISGGLVRAFSPASVLQPDALTHFLGRLDSTDPNGFLRAGLPRGSRRSPQRELRRCADHSVQRARRRAHRDVSDGSGPVRQGRARARGREVPRGALAHARLPASRLLPRRVLRGGRPRSRGRWRLASRADQRGRRTHRLRRAGGCAAPPAGGRTGGRPPRRGAGQVGRR